jgi:hypothetical protein
MKSASARLRRSIKAATAASMLRSVTADLFFGSAGLGMGNATAAKAA